MTQLNGHRAILLDAHPLWLDAVESVLASVGVEVVGKTTDPDDATALLEQHRPDLFIADIDVPQATHDGLSYLRRVSADFPSMRNVVLSDRDDTATIHGALAAGVVAYVVKTAHPDDLAAAVRQAFENSIYLANSPGADGNGDGAAEAPLTRREAEILRLVAEGRSNAQLARQLWVTEQTVKFHLSNIYRKLGVANRTEASRWAQVHGLLSRGGSAGTPEVRPSGEPRSGLAVRGR